MQARGHRIPGLGADAAPGCIPVGRAAWLRKVLTDGGEAGIKALRYYGGLNAIIISQVGDWLPTELVWYLPLMFLVEGIPLLLCKLCRRSTTTAP